MNRRSYCLVVGSLGVAGVSGCLNALDTGPDGYVRPDGAPDTIPTTFVCNSDEYEPFGKGYDENYLYWGDVDDYSLRVNKLEFEYGETAEIELAAGSRGSRNKWDFEIYTENGWRDVRSVLDGEPVAYEDIARNGNATWSIELTENGISTAGPRPGKLEVCHDLVSARYRFVYWGIEDVETETGRMDRGIAVAFDIVV